MGPSKGGGSDQIVGCDKQDDGRDSGQRVEDGGDQKKDGGQQQQQQNIGPVSRKRRRRQLPLRAAIDFIRHWFCYLVFDLVLQRGVLQPSKDGRHISLRLADDPARPPRLIDPRRGHGYLSNAIRTSRYTVFDFVPKQLLFQFTRVGNFYFLCVGIPQTIPGISTTGNYTTILPLLFFVLLTVIKEGYDDYKRHRLDKIENASIATVLRRVGDSSASGGGWVWFERLFGSLCLLLLWCSSRCGVNRADRPLRGKAAENVQEEKESCGFRWMRVRWRDIHVGDVVKLARDEDIPADLLLLYANGENDLAYVETMALDGETNLKSKQVPAPLVGGRCSTISGLVACPADVVVEDPNPDLYRFDGRITVGSETLPLTQAEVIYRGSTLRNTPYAIGLVINTGEECKSRMNANRHPRAKKPALERVTNGIVLVLAAYVILLAAGCSIGYYLFHQSTEGASWYIADVAVPAQEIILGFVIQFNNVIPLALYVSLEIVKIGQMILLNSDIAMYDEVSDTAARCNTNTILENLGQIGYIFSDKTGTLTENVMKFRKMSVAGTSWLHEADIAGKDESSDTASGEEADPLRDAKSLFRPSVDIVLEPTSSTSRTFSPTIEDRRKSRMSVESSSMVVPASPQLNRRSSSHWRSTGRPDHVQPELTTDDLLEYIRLRPNTLFSKKVIAYILAMALCHTCLPELKDGKVVGFQASSPDELALVRAAEELGFLVVQKSAQSTTLRFTYDNPDHPTEETYEVVDVLEFSSQRKRMSVIVRRPDGRLWLICKGADSVILPRLKMAPLAMQKARDVRKSADLEREMIRKSEQFEPRSHLGGPASVTIRKSFGGGSRREKVAEKAENGTRSVTVSKSTSGLSGGLKPPTTNRSQSFEVQKSARRSVDALHIRPALVSRMTSFDVHSSVAEIDSLRRSSTSATRSVRLLMPPKSPKALQQQHFQTIPEKFAFLESGSFLAEDDENVFDQCFRHMDDFAAEGLRTLLFAHKIIKEADYAAWKAEYLAAATSLTDRQERIEEVAEAIEQNLDLIGASAIEDKLQKGVPETIDKLGRANIKIWMLTGDKRETAINIAHSARLCRPGSEVYILDAAKGDLAGQLLHIAENLGLPEIGNPAIATRSKRLFKKLFKLPFSSGHAWPPLRQQRDHTVVVIDGHTLGVIEKQKARQSSAPVSIYSVDPDLRCLFYSIIPMVDSVICCRASPAQKALLVRSIRHGVSGGIGKGLNPGLTLAIGDGANDLAMLAEAHVGIGVSGKEGLQAARVADYSIAQFRFLARLLLVHGRWNYVRTAQFILATFYKEMFFYTPAAAYQWYCGYTGTSIYESWSLTVLNTLFTSLCVIIPGISEQDLGASILMGVPELYAYGQRGRGLNPPKYVSWMLTAVSQGVLVWFGCWAGYGAFQDGHDTGLFALGDLVFSTCIMWTNLKLFILNTHYKTKVLMFAFTLTVGGWWAWNAFLSGVYAPQISPYDVRNGFLHGYGQNLSWWATLFVMVVILSVMELGYYAVQRNIKVRDIWRKRSRGRGRRNRGRRGLFFSWLPSGLSWRSWRQWLACGRGGGRSGKGRENNSDEQEDIDDEYDEDGGDNAEMPADKLDLALWQELEKDPEVQERLRLINGEDEDRRGVGENITTA